jgi:hypothetical protein
MIYIRHLLQSEKTTYQSEQELVWVTEGEKTMSSVAKNMNAQFNASAWYGIIINSNRRQ